MPVPWSTLQPFAPRAAPDIPQLVYHPSKPHPLYPQHQHHTDLNMPHRSSPIETSSNRKTATMFPTPFKLTHLIFAAALTLLYSHPTSINANTNNDPPALDHDASNLVFRISLGHNNYVSFDCAHANFGPRFPTRKTLKFMLAEPSPSDGCSPIHSAHSSAFVMKRSANCEDAQRVTHAQNAKAKFAIIRSNVPGEGTPMNNDPHSSGQTTVAIDIPACIMSFSEGERLASILESHGEVDAAIPGEPLKRVTIEISASPSLSVIHPGNAHVKLSPGSVLPIQWTSTHSRAVKITLLKGHSSNPQQSWVIAERVEAPKFENTPGTWQQTNKTSHKFVFKTRPPTPSHPCTRHVTANSCQSDKTNNCRWALGSSTAQSSCVSYTPGPTTSQGPIFEYEHEPYSEYEFVPGETPVQVFEWVVPEDNEFPADRFYAIRVSYVDHPGIFADSYGYFTINGKSSLVITHPNAQQLVFFHNTKYNATWATNIHPHEGNKHSLTRVRLFLMSFNTGKDEKLRVVQQLTTADGPGVFNRGWFEFVMPAGLDPNGRYYMRIETADRSVFDVSDYYFRIAKNEIVLKTFLTTDDNQAVEMGKHVPIEWTWGGHLDRVSIALIKDADDQDSKNNNKHKAAGQMYLVASNLPNTGKFNWLVRSGTPAGTGYTLRVSDAKDDRYFANSAGRFAVRTSLFDLRIVHPNPAIPNDAVFFTGETMPIAWQTIGPFSRNDRVSIVVFRATSTGDDDGDAEEEVVHDNIARLVPIRNKALGWAIPAHYIVKGDEAQFYVQLISEDDGLSVTTASPITIKRSSLTLAVSKGGANVNKLTIAERPQHTTWLHTLERSFAIRWSVTGYVERVLVYFYCTPQSPAAGEHSDNKPARAVKLMVMATGEVEETSDDADVPGFFERYAITINSARSGGGGGGRGKRSDTQTIKGWLPLVLHTGDERLNNMPFKCSVHVENVGDAAMVSSVQGLYIDATPDRNEWTELMKDAVTVESRSGWKHMTQRSEKVEFYVNESTGAKQFATPPAFAADAAGALRGNNGGGIPVGTSVALSVSLLVTTCLCWVLCRRVVRAGGSGAKVIGFHEPTSAKVVVASGGRRPSIVMGLIKHAVGRGGDKPAQYHRGSNCDSDGDDAGLDMALQMMPLHGDKSPKSKSKNNKAVSPKRSGLLHRGSFSQVDGQEGLGADGPGGRRGRVRSGSRAGWTGVPTSEPDAAAAAETNASERSVTPQKHDTMGEQHSGEEVRGLVAAEATKSEEGLLSEYDIEVSL